MSFDKEEYRKRRAAGLRGQGDKRMVYPVLSPEEYSAKKFVKKVREDSPERADEILKEAAEDIRRRAKTLSSKDLRKRNLFKAADIVEEGKL